MPSQQYAISGIRFLFAITYILLPRHFDIKDIRPQDIVPPPTMRHQDILQHLVVVIFIVMLVVVLHNLGFAIVLSFGSQNTCAASTADDRK